MSGDEEHKQSVSRTVPVPAERLFAVLVVPARHQEIDGSGMIRGAATTAPISAVGDIFTIDMEQEAFGQYQSENHVVEFEPNRKIVWEPAGAGHPPLGHRWSWEFSPEGGSTRVTHTCDWSGVTDERILAVLNFPRVSADQMAVSIDQLVAAATNGG
jgi:uncharacterized protein YndB with AHSA1/START domain